MSESDIPLYFDFADPPAQRHSEESVAAADAIRPSAGTLRARILDLLTLEGPMTDEQMQEALAMNPSTQRPRRVELWRDGFIDKVGIAPTRAGRWAATWGVVE